MTIVSLTPNDPISATWVEDITDAANGAYLGTEGTMGADYTLTTSEADTGISVSAVATRASAYAWVQAMVTVNCTVASAGSCAARLSVAGVTQTREIEFDSNSVYRQTFSGIWKVTLSAGSTTLKLRAIKTAAGATVAILASYSVLAVDIRDLP